MTRRVIIDSTATSPFRISVAGVDAASAEFNDLIFDGNQLPLRLWHAGYLEIAGITYNEFAGGQTIRSGVTAALFPTPAGTSAMFKCMWRNASDSLGRIYTPSYLDGQNPILGGGGGGVCSGVFKGANFTRGVPGAPNSAGATIYCNYAVFRNYF